MNWRWWILKFLTCNELNTINCTWTIYFLRYLIIQATPISYARFVAMITHWILKWSGSSRVSRLNFKVFLYYLGFQEAINKIVYVFRLKIFNQLHWNFHKLKVWDFKWNHHGCHEPSRSFKPLIVDTVVHFASVSHASYLGHASLQILVLLAQLLYLQIKNVDQNLDSLKQIMSCSKKKLLDNRHYARLHNEQNYWIRIRSIQN